MGCSETDSVTISTSIKDATADQQINISMVDSRLKFHSFNDFSNFVVLNEGSRIERLEQYDLGFAKNDKSIDSSKYIITSELIRSIANDDNMYQTSELHSSSTAYIPIPEDRYIVEVISQGVLAKVTKHVSDDITYQIERVIGFPHDH
jgi:hypothetical protein